MKNINRKENEDVIVNGFMEGDCCKKFLNWDGSNCESFVESFSIEALRQMDCWSYEYGNYYGYADEMFPEFGLSDETEFVPLKVKEYIIKGFISSCLTMLIMGAAYSEEMSQKELVSHFYDLWIAVEGGC